MKVLNVGGSVAAMPARYDGYEKVLLDIDADVKPDLCFDAKDLRGRADLREQFDVVFSSHCLEHFYRHDVAVVLEGFNHVLSAEGYVDIRVPDVGKLINHMRERNLSVTDTWYRTGDNQPISFHDALFGWNVAMSNGNLYYAHRCGFTSASLSTALAEAGFKSVWVAATGLDLHALAYKKEGVPCPQP